MILMISIFEIFRIFSGPNYAYVDPTAEDTMVVQLILASRMGTRELESDEEDENAFEVSREHLTKFIGKAPPTKSQLQEAIEKAAIDAKNPKPEQVRTKKIVKFQKHYILTKKNREFLLTFFTIFHFFAKIIRETLF